MIPIEQFWKTGEQQMQNEDMDLIYQDESQVNRLKIGQFMHELPEQKYIFTEKTFPLQCLQVMTQGQNFTQQQRANQREEERNQFKLTNLPKFIVKMFDQSIHEHKNDFKEYMSEFNRTKKILWTMLKSKKQYSKNINLESLEELFGLGVGEKAKKRNSLNRRVMKKILTTYLHGSSIKKSKVRPQNYLSYFQALHTFSHRLSHPLLATRLQMK